MCVVVLNSPWRNKDRLGVRAGSRWPFTVPSEKRIKMDYLPFPFFLAYTTALLKKNNFKTRFIDAIAQRINAQELMPQIVQISPDFIITEVSTPSIENDLKFLKDIKIALPKAQIAISGPHASVYVQEILLENQFIDYVLIGEYEFTALKLIKAISEKTSLEKIGALGYKDGNRIRINSAREEFLDVDSLPWPERTDVPIYSYRDAFSDMPEPTVQILASRGCAFECVYCLWPQTIYNEREHRKRDYRDVVDEFEYLTKEMQFESVYFDDDVFNLDKQYVLDICGEIVKRKIKIPWAIMARADLMDEELMSSLARAGLYAIKYGIESADGEMLRKCKKNLSLEKARKTIELTKELGIKVHLTFCLGLPGENKKTIEKTKSFIKETAPDSIQISFATPFPGTEYFSYMKEKGHILTDNWQDYDGNQGCIIRTEDLNKEELEAARDDIYNSFNAK